VLNAILIQHLSMLQARSECYSRLLLKLQQTTTIWHTLLKWNCWKTIQCWIKL